MWDQGRAALDCCAGATGERDRRRRLAQQQGSGGERERRQSRREWPSGRDQDAAGNAGASRVPLASSGTRGAEAKRESSEAHPERSPLAQRDDHRLIARE
jgi:hypothetical protein